ncbi:hypothetical protein TorRG33x02_067500 [Trema orientale]|uniref:Putative plant transposon protein domain-containing protein n=1 Tax=Trema orientale TaxID=63057 RepID=A0A2P5FIC3_TREOI|nr:hypothetical protein TorRG33x02_067500 [Trema orientale]
MAPKRKTTFSTSSSSSSSYIKKRFVSAKAEKRYTTFVTVKSPIQEWGFEDPGEEIEAIIATRKWQEFTKQPEPGTYEISAEFYVNAKEHNDFKVFVRDKWVSFHRSTINRYYKLPDIDNDEYCELQDQGVDPEEVIHYLARPGTEWNRSKTDVANFPAVGLNNIPNAMHYFISIKFLPSSSFSEVTNERAILNYAILKGLSIDVGKIIQHNISHILKGTINGGLAHPSLIYGLCRQADVPTRPDASPSVQEDDSHVPPPPEASTAQMDLSHQIHAMREHMTLMQQSISTQQQWQEVFQHQFNQFAAHQEQHFAYQLQFNDALVQLFSNCALNSGANAVMFPTPPQYPPFEPNQPEFYTPPPPPQGDDYGDD